MMPARCNGSCMQLLPVLSRGVAVSRCRGVAVSPSIRRMSRLLVRTPRFGRSVEVCGEHSSDTPIASERLPRRSCPLRPPSGQPPRLLRRWRRSSRAIFESVEQSCLGPRPARRQPDALGLGNYRIKVGEDLLHDLGLLDARPHPQAGQVSMSIPKTRFRRCAQLIEARRSPDVGSSLSPVAAR